MNIFIWVLQGFACLVFLYSGICKSILAEKKLVEKGQTGVEGLAIGLIRFIGITEILGSIGLVLPVLLNIYPLLTPLAALCMGAIMVPASIIHAKRKEYKSVFLNFVILLVCLSIAWYRY